jgi:hypothetical protein
MPNAGVLRPEFTRLHQLNPVFRSIDPQHQSCQNPFDGTAFAPTACIRGLLASTGRYQAYYWK